MPNSDPKLLKSLKGKLGRLLSCVVAHASKDPAFAEELAAALMTNRESASREGRRPATRSIRFSPVAFLHEHGQDQLRTELGKMTDDELREIVRAQGIAKGKEAKTMDRDKMINLVVQHSNRRLHQGSAFLS
jgi:hypothetical protein